MEQGYVPAIYYLAYKLSEENPAPKDKVITMMQTCLEKKYIYAFNFMAWCNKEGWGVETDLKKSIELYTLAANRGLARARNAMGDFYSNGIVVNKDNELAKKWYALAAEQGFADAETKLKKLNSSCVIC